MARRSPFAAVCLLALGTVSAATLAACGGDEGSSAGSGTAGSSGAGAGSGGDAATGGSDRGAGGSAMAGDAAGGAAGAGNRGGAAGAGNRGGAGPGSNVTLGETCPAFAPCGGDLLGSWSFDDGCITYDDIGVDPDAIAQASMCPEVEVSARGSLDGGVVFTADMVTRPGSLEASVDIDLPASCLPGYGALGGAIICPIVEDQVKMSAPMDPNVQAITCSENAGLGCRCSAPREGMGWGTTGYTTSDDVITLTNGRTFEYCVQGDTLKYRETTDNAAEPGLYTLERAQ